MDLAAGCTAIRLLAPPALDPPPRALVFALKYPPLPHAPASGERRRTLTIPMSAVVSADQIESDTECIAHVVLSDGAFVQWHATNPELATFQLLTGSLMASRSVTEMDNDAWHAWATTEVPAELAPQPP